MKAELSRQMSARQMELESTADKRRRVEEELNVRKAQAARSAQAAGSIAHRSIAIESPQGFARRDSFASRIYSRKREAIVHRHRARRGRGFHAAGVLADFVEVEPAYEKATEEFLHEELEYVVVHNWNEAERGIDLMRTDLDGRATFLVHPEAGEQARAVESLRRRRRRARPAERSSAVHQRLCERAARSAAAVGALFPGQGSPGGAAAGHRSIPSIFFLLPDGVSYHGHAVSGGKKTGSGPLALKRELRELTGEVQVKQRAVEGTATALEQLEREIAGIQRRSGEPAVLQQNQEKEALALDHEHRQLAEEFARAQSRLSVARLELERSAAGRRPGPRAAGARSTVAGREGERARSMEEQVLEQSRADFEELQSAARIAGGRARRAAGRTGRI